MARKAIVAKNLRRKRLIEKYQAKREELKKLNDFEGLQKLPRNSSPTRWRNRCSITGRGRGVYADYLLCRNMFRQLALEGKLPGIRKASW